jgi:SAM-dependent methyltransferase
MAIMIPVSGQKRYELFGWDYLLRNPPSPESVAWHRRHAAETGGPVLELACGTGSLLAPLAAAGLEVVGLDLSEEMLRIARQRIAELPGDVRDRIRLVHADMGAFDLGREFPLVVLADNSFRELTTEEELASCLRCVARHLEPGGRLLLTENRFDRAFFDEGGREWDWSEPLVLTGTGAEVSRKIRVRVLPDGKRTAGIMTYRVKDPDGAERTVDCEWEAPLLAVPDYHRLFAGAGLRGTLTVDYGDREDDGAARTLNFVVRRET